MKTIKWIVLLILLPIYSFSQNYLDYYKRLNTGDWALVSEKDTTEFIKQYEEAFSLFEPFIFDRIKLINMYASVKNWDKIAGHLIEALKKGYPLTGNGLKLGDFKGSPLYQEIEDNEKDYIDTFLTGIDFDLFEKMFRLAATDQYLALNNPHGVKDTLWTTMREKVFLKNIHLLLEVAKQNTYPGERKVGHYAFGQGAGAILIHNPIIFDDPESPQNTGTYVFVEPSRADSIAMKELRDILKPMVMKGLISREEYVQLYDNLPRMTLHGTQKIQYYGQGSKWGSNTLIPIWDIQNIDKRRAEIGLPPLYQYAKSKGLELPPEYIMPTQEKK
jgi:hypothetical protein